MYWLKQRSLTSDKLDEGRWDSERVENLKSRDEGIAIPMQVRAEEWKRFTLTKYLVTYTCCAVVGGQILYDLLIFEQQLLRIVVEEKGQE